MKVLDLFSGIGGFSLGLERAGMETVAFCEIEPFCQKVLRKHWPEVPIYDDVTKLTAEQLQHDGITADLICGGYPCQPFSQAGKRQGAEDDRHLWPEMYRLIKAINPRWVVAENVFGHIDMGLDQVLSDLEAIKYSWWAFVIPACAKDAPHRRDRLWVLAHSNKVGLSGGEHEPSEQWAEDRTSQRSCTAGKGGNVSNPNGERLERSSTGRQVQERQTSTGYGGQGSATHGGLWPVEPSICRVANGIPNRVDRIKSLGNAVVPQIPEIIGKAIMEQSS